MNTTLPKTKVAAVSYEWAVEETNPETENIEDVNHYPLAEIAQRYPLVSLPENIDVCLVRDDWKPSAGSYRSWAYLKDGKLPTHFEDAYGDEVATVPRRFHAELARLTAT